MLIKNVNGVAAMLVFIFFVTALPNCRGFNYILEEISSRLQLFTDPFDYENNFKISVRNYENLKNFDPDSELTTPDLIKKEGFTAETHVVQTDDGYELTLHRIPGPSESKTIFLQHGLLGSSADWVLTDKDKSLAFILAKRGYDVWFGNARGNTYSRSHVKYPSYDVRFWNFSWHEMGVHDLPAAITYISNKKNDSLIYIGHSMGTTMFYVMACEKPEIASKVKAMYSLAPVAFMNHLKSPIRLLSPFSRQLDFLLEYLGRGQFLPQNIILKYLAKYGCEINVQEERICANSLFVIMGFDKSQFNYTLLPSILGHTPAGASTKTLIHYAQEISSGKFQNFDYGHRKNKIIYNSTEPPEYDLTKIKVPIALFYADNDWLSSPIDVKKLSELIPRLMTVYRIDYPKFNHIDFLWGLDAPKLVYDKLLSLISEVAGAN